MSIKSEALKELSSARDEARLRLHLLTMEARGRWAELEQRLDSFEQDLVGSGEHATEVTLSKARHLAQSVRAFFKRNQ